MSGRLSTILLFMLQFLHNTLRDKEGIYIAWPVSSNTRLRTSDSAELLRGGHLSRLLTFSPPGQQQARGGAMAQVAHSQCDHHTDHSVALLPGASDSAAMAGLRDALLPEELRDRNDWLESKVAELEEQLLGMST